MGKRGGDKRLSPNLNPVSHKAISLREEKAGKKQADTASVKSKLKLQHLQSLAVWASGEASVPSLAALFGRRLASATEALGLQPDPSLNSCQRCETILQPGFNCTIRIEKNQVKTQRRRKKPGTSTQNIVVYTCHFCSHRNFKRGTPEGHMKEICLPKVKPPSKPKCAKSPLEKFSNSVKDARSKDEVGKAIGIATPAMATDSMSANSARDTINIDEVSKVVEVAMPAIVTDSLSANSAKDARNKDDDSQVNKTALPAIARDSVSANSAEDTSSEVVEITMPAIATEITMSAIATDSVSANSANDARNKDDDSQGSKMALLAIARDPPASDSPATPSVRTKVTLEGKKRKRSKSGAKKPPESESNSAITDAEKSLGASSKRKRKSWASLKEIAERSEHDNGQNITKLAIPFSL